MLTIPFESSFGNKSRCSNFGIITAIFSGVQIFIFTITCFTRFRTCSQYRVAHFDKMNPSLLFFRVKQNIIISRRCDTWTIYEQCFTVPPNKAKTYPQLPQDQPEGRESPAGQEMTAPTLSYWFILQHKYMSQYIKQQTMPGKTASRSYVIRQ